MEGYEGNHTLKISLKGKRKTLGKSLYLEIFVSVLWKPKKSEYMLRNF